MTVTNDAKTEPALSRAAIEEMDGGGAILETSALRFARVLLETLLLRIVRTSSPLIFIKLFDKN